MPRHFLPSHPSYPHSLQWKQVIYNFITFRMRSNLLPAALLLSIAAVRADRSSSWWRDSSTASLSNSQARTAGVPGRVREAILVGWASFTSYQRAAQDGFEPLQQVGGDDPLQAGISNPRLSLTPASTQVLFFFKYFSQLFPRWSQLRRMSPPEATLTR